MYEKLFYMLNANASNNPSVAKQLQGLSFDEIVAIVENHKQLLSKSEQIIAQRDQVIAQKDNALFDAKALNEKLVFELSYLNRKRYGKQSESLGGSVQAQLFEAARIEDIAAVEAEIERLFPAISVPSHVRRVAKREQLPGHLPRVDIHHEVEASVCGHELKRIGESVTEILNYVPGTFTVDRHIRGKWACAHCKTLVQAPVPAQVIDKGLPSASLMAHAMVSKYHDHLPVYRLEQIYARSGYAVPQSTLSGWLGNGGAQLMPLVEAFKEIILKCQVLHANETPVSMLSPGKGKTHRSYIWAYAPGQFEEMKGVIFDFCESRSGEHNRKFLGSWRGSLVTDDYAGYKQLYENGVIEVGCMAHARRKFFDLFENNKSPMAKQALEFIQELYEVEREVKNLSTEERLAIRQRKSKPIAELMHRWLIAHRLEIPDKSVSARAMDYSIKRWDALVRYIDDAQLPIDNNLIENTIRPIAIGRGNWLFAGSLRAGKRAAAIMSLIQSAKMNGHDPYLYLKDILERLPTQKNHLIHELLPHLWQPKQP